MRHSLAFLLLAAAAAAQDIWVDVQRGHDSNPGTFLQPVRSITAGLRLAIPGGHVFVLPGTYGIQASGETLPLLFGTTNHRQVTLQGLGSAVIDLTNQPAAALTIGSGANGGRLTGFTFQGTGTTGYWACAIEAGSFFGSSTAASFEIDRCTFRAVNRGIVLWTLTAPVRSWRIHNNLFLGTRVDALEELDGASVNQIFSNTIVGAQGIGILSDGLLSQVSNNVVTGCSIGISTRNLALPGLRFSANDVWANVRDWDGISAPAGNLGVDPLFVAPQSGDYRLLAISRLIDAGSMGLPARADLDGNPGAADSLLSGTVRPDIGAYEHNPVGLAGYHNFDRLTLRATAPAAWPVVVMFGLGEGLVSLPGQSPWLVDPSGLLSVMLAGTTPLQLELSTLPLASGTRVLMQGIVLRPVQAPLLITNLVDLLQPALRSLSVVEGFQSDRMLDKAFSGGTFGGGMASPGLLGDDGRLGDFDVTDGVQVATNVWEWSTDSQRIPGKRTLNGSDEFVYDGVFRFAHFKLPFPLVLRFKGSKSPQILVRGSCEVEGRIELNAPAMTGYSKAWPTGQPGGAGAVTGGAGGKGADAGDGTANQPRFNGQPGEDVKLIAGHAYAAFAPGTGGQGSPQYPTDGRWQSITFKGLSRVLSGQACAGGGGGGFSGPGANGKVIFTQSGEAGPDGLGGIALSLLPIPAGASIRDHFLVGGSGAGGGGSHPFGSSNNGPSTIWGSGAGGAGGGGAIALRAGADLTMPSSGAIEAKGGTGAQMSAPPPAPGGGGAGGAIVLQAAGKVALSGYLDVLGGQGGFTNDRTIYQIETRGGDGAPGVLRLEVPGNPSAGLLGVTFPPATPSDVGTLTEVDLVTGNQTLWYATGYTTETPVFDRYEVDALVSGVKVTYSDDPAHGPIAGPGQAVRFYIQGGKVDPTTGQVDPTSIGPWRTQVGNHMPGSSLDRDHPTGYRFLLLFDRAVASSVVVTRVEVFFRGL